MIGIFARYIAIAPPERNEWHPISATLNPSSCSPIDAAALSFVRIWLDEIYDNLPDFDKYVFTIELSLLWGYDLIRLVMRDQLFTGHRFSVALCNGYRLELFFIFLGLKSN